MFFSVFPVGQNVFLSIFLISMIFKSTHAFFFFTQKQVVICIHMKRIPLTILLFKLKKKKKNYHDQRILEAVWVHRTTTVYSNLVRSQGSLEICAYKQTLNIGFVRSEIQEHQRKTNGHKMRYKTTFHRQFLVCTPSRSYQPTVNSKPTSAQRLS